MGRNKNKYLTAAQIRLGRAPLVRGADGSGVGYAPSHLPEVRDADKDGAVAERRVSAAARMLARQARKPRRKRSVGRRARDRRKL